MRLSVGSERSRRTLSDVGRSDIALAAALAALALLDVLLSGEWRGPVEVNAVVVPLMALSLLWRRSAPLGSLAAVVAGLSGLSLAFGGSQTWSSVFIVLVAVYSAGAHGELPVVAAVLAATGVAVHDLRDPDIQTFGDAVYSSTLLALTFLAGLAGRALNKRARAVEERAEALARHEHRRAAAAAALERRRIARELHDVISHSLGVLVLQAGAAEQVLERDPARARGVLASIRAGGQEAIRELTTLLGVLDEQPSATHEPQPSLGDLERLVDRVRDSGVPVDLHVEGSPRTLPATLELSAFRIVQEGLTNAIKHATPSLIEVVVRYGASALEIDVLDDGQDVGNRTGGRRGLAGVAERVALFGGHLESGPRPGGGWALRAVLPLT